MERRLAAILCADVYGYSRLMGQDEEATLLTLSSHRRILDNFIEHHRGRVVNSAGDSVLAEFFSVVNAVQCAVDIQRRLHAENAGIESSRRMEFRIGVNLGDVITQGDQIYGDGVNVAARLESLADPGGIYISSAAHDQIKNKLLLSYEDLGPQSVKNIAEPIRVFRVITAGVETASSATKRWVTGKYARRSFFSVAGLAVAVGTIVLAQHVSLRAPVTTASIPPLEKPAMNLPEVPSIAVLPFTNGSGDRDQEYFSDGITDDLVTALSRLPSLFVIARTSTFIYKNKAVNAQDIGRALDVKYLLEGSVRRSDRTIRITAQLVDASTGHYLWAHHYDRHVQDVFAVQDEVVRSIVTILNLQLTLAEQGFLVTKQTDNLDAYDAFLRGVEYASSIVVEQDNLRARQMFERAIRLDSNYADAYIQLGLTYYADWIWHWGHETHPLDRAFELEQHALALDDSQPLALAVSGEILLFKGRYDEALSDGERAIVVGPNVALAYFWLADILNRSARPAEAIPLVDKAIRLDPELADLYVIQKGISYNRLGRYADAIPIVQRHLARYPNDLAGHILMIVDCTELGRRQQAQAEVADLLRIDPKFSLDLFRQRVPDKDRSWLQHRDADLRKAGLT